MKKHHCEKLTIYFFLCREIEERKKEVDQFFKSDSEDEEFNEHKQDIKQTSPVKEDVDFELPSLTNCLDDQTIVNEDSTNTALESENLSNEAKTSKDEDGICNENEMGGEYENDKATICEKDEIETLASETNKESCEDSTEVEEIHSNNINTSCSEDKLELLSTDSKQNLSHNEIDKDEESCSENLLKAAFLDKDFWLDSKEDSNKDLDCQDEDDLQLHLDTEPLDDLEDSSQKETSLKSGNESDNHSQLSLSSALKSQKLCLLTSKFPHLKLNKLTEVKPRLSFEEGEYVDLDAHKTPDRHQGVEDLLQRFVKHSNTKRKLADAQQVTLG